MLRFDRCQQFQPRLGQHARLQILRQRAASRDHRTEPVGAERLQREPGLQRAEAARQVGAEIAGPDCTRRKPPRLAAQIGRRLRKGLPVLLAVAHQQEAGVVGHLPPFVEVERDGIGELDAAEQRRELGREDRERPEGAIDVKPDSFLAAQRSDRLEIVDRADIDRAGGCRPPGTA